MVDCVNETSFTEKLPLAINKWKRHEESKEAVSGFCEWLLKYKVDVIIHTMLRSVREKAGLGCPPNAFYTNASECMNSVIKVKVEYKRSELPEFINKLHDLCEEQEREVERAVLRQGKYRLRPQYRHLEVSESKWFKMTREQRARHLKKVNQVPVSDVTKLDEVTYISDVTGLSHSSSVSVPSCSSSADSGPSHAIMYTSTVSNPSHSAACASTVIDPSHSVASASTVSDMSHSGACKDRNVTLSSLCKYLLPLSSHLGLPSAAIEAIAQKVLEIVNVEGAIVPAPGHHPTARMVISKSGKWPHLVLPKKNGGMAWDDDCPQYKSASLCSHVVAAALHNEQLTQLVLSDKKVKCTPNLTKLATSEMLKGRGRKGGKALQEDVSTS